MLYLIIGNKQPSLHTPIERRQTHYFFSFLRINHVQFLRLNLKRNFTNRVWVYSYMYASILLNMCIYYSLLLDFQFSYIQNNYRILLSYWLNKNSHNSRKKKNSPVGPRSLIRKLRWSWVSDNGCSCITIPFLYQIWIPFHLPLVPKQV